MTGILEGVWREGRDDWGEKSKLDRRRGGWMNRDARKRAGRAVRCRDEG